jgi:hypothetical protein
MGMVLAGLVIGGFGVLRARALMFTSGLASVLAFALWFNWSHWVDLSHQWTQRDQFWRYYTNRKAGEPIAAFLMNWRGESGLANRCLTKATVCCARSSMG